MEHEICDWVVVDRERTRLQERDVELRAGPDRIIDLPRLRPLLCFYRRLERRAGFSNDLPDLLVTEGRDFHARANAVAWLIVRSVLRLFPDLAGALLLVSTEVANP